MPHLGDLDSHLKLQNTIVKINQSINSFLLILKSNTLNEEQKKPFREIAKKLSEYLSSTSSKPDTKLLKEIAKIIKERAERTQGISQEEKDNLLKIAKSLEEAARELESNPLLNPSETIPKQN